MSEENKMCSEKILMLYKMCDEENLQVIAKRFEIPPKILLDINKNIKIADGVTIVIPKREGSLYKVAIGDTIDSICVKFSITKQQFKDKNTAEFLYHGMWVWV